MGKLTDFIKEYKQKNISRFHMPGHKGNCPDLTELGGPYDITEINGADSLFEARGILMELEQRYSALYQCNTVLSAGGSTLSIQAMLALTSANSKVLAVRNAHIAFINSCVLLDIEPVWIYPDYSYETGLLAQPTAAQIETELKNNKDISAVYITSPDYMGTMADISKISIICKKYGVKLLVDNAHGAHLKFGKKDLFPIALGADFCCSSAHKTLPALTGGAFLHAKDCPQEQLKSAMKLFASTSPSYLILQSLDLCADYLEEQGTDDYIYLEGKWKEIAQISKQSGIDVYGDDKTKLSFDAASAGMRGEELAEHFRQYLIEPEYISGRHVVLMISPFLRKQDFDRLETALLNISKAEGTVIEGFVIPKAEHVLSPRKSAFSLWEGCKCESALERISAENISTCPPGIPIVIVGERISKPIVNLLKNNGIHYIKVVK